MSHAGRLAGCWFLVAVLAATAYPAAAAEVTQPKVHVIATGGTIAGAQSAAGGYGYKAGEYDVGVLLQAVPGLASLAMVSGEQLASIGSQDMNDAIWLQLARRIETVLAGDGADAVLVTHGTDTMEETAYFLSLTVKSRKPVVMVGSMRPATAISADGPGNLYNAVAVATDPDAPGRGTLVCLNDEIHYARNVVKVDTTNVQAFASPNRGPAGLVHSGRVAWLEPMDRKLGPDAPFAVLDLDRLPRVDILYAHANMGTEFIETAIASGAQGIVIAGVGDGNMSATALDALAQAARRGIAVVRSTRLPKGMVLRNSEVDDDALGFIASGELNPAKSRVLLQLALTQTRDPAAIQKMFYEY
jgi:L-asparaginase